MEEKDFWSKNEQEAAAYQNFLAEAEKEKEKEEKTEEEQ